MRDTADSCSRRTRKLRTSFFFIIVQGDERAFARRQRFHSIECNVGLPLEPRGISQALARRDQLAHTEGSGDIQEIVTESFDVGGLKWNSSQIAKALPKGLLELTDDLLETGVVKIAAHPHQLAGVEDLAVIDFERFEHSEK